MPNSTQNTTTTYSVAIKDELSPIGYRVLRSSRNFDTREEAEQQKQFLETHAPKEVGFCIVRSTLDKWEG